jgi:hypothetical protein
VELFQRPTPNSLSDLWHDLRRRIELYFLVVNIAVTLKQGLINLWTQLHQPDQSFCAHDWQGDERRVAYWVCGRDNAGRPMLSPDIHISEWAAVTDRSSTHSIQ